MLCMTRRMEDEVWLDVPEGFAGGRIVVKVIGLEVNGVKLGIKAPKEVQIQRDDATVTAPSPRRERKAVGTG